MERKLVEIRKITRRFKNFKAGDKQNYIEVYPKKGKHERSDIDIFRVVMNAYNEKTGLEYFYEEKI